MKKILKLIFSVLVIILIFEIIGRYKFINVPSIKNMITGTKESPSGEALDSANEQPPQVSVNLYAYETLPQSTRLVYDQIVDVLLQFDQTATVSTTDDHELKQAFQSVLADHPEIFWVETYSIMSYSKNDEILYLEVTPEYNCSQEEAQQKQIQIDSAVSSCLDGISINADEYEKVKYVFDYIVQSTDYNEEAADSQNICSVFLNHSSVCMGYARSVQYLLNKLNITAVTVSGDSTQGAHAWNLVKADGEYYYLDATWGDMQFEGHASLNTDINYAYLNITTEEISKTHTPSDDFELPDCTANADNYYVHEGWYLDSFSKKQIDRMILQCMENNQTLSLKCSTEDIYNQLYEYLIEDGNICDYTDAEKINYLEIKELFVLTIRL